MSFSNRMKASKALFGISMMFLVAGLLLFQFHRSGTQIARDSIHAASGLFVGISLGLVLMSVRQAARQRRHEGN